MHGFTKNLQQLLNKINHDQMLNKSQTTTLINLAKEEQKRENNKRHFNFMTGIVTIALLMIYFIVIVGDHIMSDQQYMISSIALMAVCHFIGFHLSKKKNLNPISSALHSIGSCLFIFVNFILTHQYIAAGFATLSPIILITQFLIYSIILTTLALLLNNGPITLLSALCFFLTAILGFLVITPDMNIYYMGQVEQLSHELPHLLIYFFTMLLLCAQMLKKKHYAQSQWLYIPGIIGLTTWLYTQIMQFYLLPVKLMKATMLPTFPSPILLILFGLNVLCLLYVWLSKKEGWLDYYFLINITVILLLGFIAMTAFYLKIPPNHANSLYHIGSLLALFLLLLWGIFNTTAHEQIVSLYIYTFLMITSFPYLLQHIMPHIDQGNHTIISGLLFILMSFCLGIRKKALNHERLNEK